MFLFCSRNLARKYKTGLLEYWDFINTYADFTTNEGLTLLENHLASKLREFEEDDAKKIFDLENELAGLNLESNERSFTAILPDETPLQSMTSETSMLDYRNGNNLVSPAPFIFWLRGDQENDIILNNKFSPVVMDW